MATTCDFTVTRGGHGGTEYPINAPHDHRWVLSMDRGTADRALRRRLLPQWLPSPRSASENDETFWRNRKGLKSIFGYVNSYLGGNAHMLRPSVSVVVPALNEARNIPHVFSRLPADIFEVVLVDGFSEDDTVAIARELRPDVRVVLQTRRGKGNALACGFAEATGDIIAMVDADGSADPGEIPRFVAALLEGADFAKGTRFAEGGGSSDITRLRSFGNYFLTSFFNTCYGTKYSDLCYGFNVFWRRHLPVLGLDAISPLKPDGHGTQWGDGFEVETLIHVRVAKAGLIVAEVPSCEHARIHGVSNLNAYRDGRRVLRTILTERRQRRPSSRSSNRPSAWGRYQPPMRWAEAPDGSNGLSEHPATEGASDDPDVSVAGQGGRR